MNEGDDRRQVGLTDRQRRHPLVGAPVVDDRADLVSLDVFRHKLRAREVRARFAAHGIAAVAEAAVRDEQRLARSDLVRRVGHGRLSRGLGGGEDAGGDQDRRPEGDR